MSQNTIDSVLTLYYILFEVIVATYDTVGGNAMSYSPSVEIKTKNNETILYCEYATRFDAEGGEYAPARL